LCSANYILDATNVENRVRYLALMNAAVGVASGIGALVGGFLLTHLPPLWGYHSLTLFLISGLLRAVVVAAMLPGLPEVRRVSMLTAMEAFHLVTGGRPLGRFGSFRRHHFFHHARRDDQPAADDDAARLT